MKKIMMAAAMAATVCTGPLDARTKTYQTEEFTLPADKPVTIVLMRPDVQVGTLTTGGLAEVNAEWTDQARGHIRTALEANQKRRGTELRVLDESSGDAAQLVGDYEALHRAV